MSALQKEHIRIYKWNDINVIKTFKSETQTLKGKVQSICVAANLVFNHFRLILIKKWTKDLPLSRFEIVKYKSRAFWAPAS